MAPIPDQRPPSAPRRERPLVLLIEDNVTQLDLYSMVIEEELSLLTATRGETGYALACSEKPDVIVVDVLLPDVDGLTVCQRLRANPQTSSIPIVVLTGDDGAHDRAQRVASQFSGVLTKPCPAELLLSTLRSAIEARGPVRRRGCLIGGERIWVPSIKVSL